MSPSKTCLRCFRCGRYLGWYDQATTVTLGLYCAGCKGHCVFEAKSGELTQARFEPKSSNAAQACVETDPPPSRL